MSREAIAAAQRVVVKVGSSSLTGRGRIDPARLDALVDALAQRRADGRQVLLVSSGAIAAGIAPLQLRARPRDLATQQAAASVGQLLLAERYAASFARHGLTVGQVLLTADDLHRRGHYSNASRTLERLLALGVIPIVNENDTVATHEIRFGDNDRLAARVAAMISADTLVLLSDIDGLYTADPRKDAAARLIPEVRELTPEIEAMAGDALPGYSSGGMVTKLAAARIAMKAGCRMVIAKGNGLHPLTAIESGAAATWFIPSAEPLTARKSWIAGALNPVGVLNVDDGAAQALKRGKSLLPAGITAVDGEFERGDAVIVRARGGGETARGLTAYSSADIRRIAGHKSSEIAAILGYRGRDEVIHRDDLVLTG